MNHPKKERMNNPICSASSAPQYSLARFFLFLITRAVLVIIENSRRIWRRVSRHDSFTITLGTPYGFLLTLPPTPRLTHLFRLSKLLRGLMKRFAFLSHNRNITHNP